MPAHDGSAAAAAQDHRLLASQVRLPCCSLPPCADRYIDRASIPALTGSSTSSLVRTMSSRTFSVWTRSPASHASRAAASRARTAPRTATSARLSGRSSPRSTRNTPTSPCQRAPSTANPASTTASPQVARLGCPAAPTPRHPGLTPRLLPRAYRRQPNDFGCRRLDSLHASFADGCCAGDAGHGQGRCKRTQRSLANQDDGDGRGEERLGDQDRRDAPASRPGRSQPSSPPAPHYACETFSYSRTAPVSSQARRSSPPRRLPPAAREAFSSTLLPRPGPRQALTSSTPSSPTASSRWSA